MVEQEKLKQDHDNSSWGGKGIKNSIIAVQNISNANVIYSKFSNAQANSVVIIAGRDVDSRVENEVEKEKC